MEDLSGKSRIAKNASAGFLSHFVFVIFGFLMPRVIDENIGQTALGIWDFGWSIVAYMNLAMLGIGGSVNRFVAKYRAEGDESGLNRVVSTVVAIQIAVAFLVFLASVSLAYWLPDLMRGRLSGYEDVARYVVAGLGTALAIEMLFDVWRGVMTGCHRWDYHNGLNAAGNALSSVSMLTVLISGYGLKQMVIAHLSAVIITELARFRIARGVCPELKIDLTRSNWKDVRGLTKFGLKTILLGAPVLITTQTVNLFIMAHLGPAALALIARPVALMRHVATLANKFSFVLTPTAGYLQAQNRTEELRSFALESARVGWILAIVPLVFLIAAGDVVLEVWMGPNYANGVVCAVLAAGYILPISQGPQLRVLIGMDAHGRVAKWAMTLSMTILALGVAIVSVLGWTEVRAALIIASTSTFGMGAVILIAGIRNLDISPSSYLRTALIPSARIALSIGIAIVLFRKFVEMSPVDLLLSLCLLTALLSLILLRSDIKRAWAGIRR